LIIFVTGIPGAGKSTLAKALAAKLGCTILDFDADFRRLLGAWKPGTKTSFSDACYEMIFVALRFWVESRSEETVIFTAPMIHARWQQALQKFCIEYPKMVKLVDVTFSDDTDDNVRARLAKRKAGGYDGGINTLEDYRRVKGTTLPLPLSHRTVDTSPPRSVEECVSEALAYINR